GDRSFGDTTETAGRFDCDYLDPWIDELCPVSINGGTSSGEGKAKQPKSGSHSWADNDKPTTAAGAVALDSGRFGPMGFRGKMFRLDDNRLRSGLILNCRVCGYGPTASAIVGLQHDRLQHGFIVGSGQLRQNLIDEVVDAGALNQTYGRDLDLKGGFQPVCKRHRHKRVESVLAKSPSRIDRFGDSQCLHRLLADKADEQFAAARSGGFPQSGPNRRRIRVAPSASDRLVGFGLSIERITCSCCDRRSQYFRRQWFQRQAFDRGCESTVVLIDGNVDGEHF